MKVVSKHRRMSKSRLTLLLEEEENKNDSKRDEKRKSDSQGEDRLLNSTGGSAPALKEIRGMI